MDSSLCYLFNKAGFFQGYPPQECVTRHFVENRDKMGYTTFPVFRKYGHYWDFLDWDDPDAEAIWEPYVNEGKYIDPEELEEETTPELEAAHEADLQLFAYYAAQSDSSSYAYCSEDTDDPIMCFNKLLSGPFHSDAFASEIDRCVWSYMSQSELPMTDKTFSILANDVATSNLQLLTKRSDDDEDEMMVHDQRSVPLSKTIYANLQPKQSTKNKLHFLDYLSRVNEDAKSEIFKYKSLATALLHLPDNTVVDMDDDDFDRFAAYYHPSTLDILPNFMRYLDKRKVRRDRLAQGISTLVSKPSATLTYRDYLERMSEYFDDPGEGLAHIDSQSQVLEAVESRMNDLSDSTVSPEYQPQSPEVNYDSPEDDFVVLDLERSTTKTVQKPERRTRSSDKGKMKAVSVRSSYKKLSQQEFLHCLIACISYCMFVEQELNPSQKFSDNFGFRACLDFNRRFRLRYKLFYISFDFKANIDNDVEKFISSYVKRKYGRVPIVEVIGR